MTFQIAVVKEFDLRNIISLTVCVLASVNESSLQHVDRAEISEFPLVPHYTFAACWCHRFSLSVARENRVAREVSQREKPELTT